jgi:hypothetical protein
MKNVNFIRFVFNIKGEKKIKFVYLLLVLIVSFEKFEQLDLVGRMVLGREVVLVVVQAIWG